MHEEQSVSRAACRSECDVLDHEGLKASAFTRDVSEIYISINLPRNARKLCDQECKKRTELRAASPASPRKYGRCTRDFGNARHAAQGRGQKRRLVRGKGAAAGGRPPMHCQAREGHREGRSGRHHVRLRGPCAVQRLFGQIRTAHSGAGAGARTQKHAGAYHVEQTLPEQGVAAGAPERRTQMDRRTAHQIHTAPYAAGGRQRPRRAAARRVWRRHVFHVRHNAEGLRRRAGTAHRPSRHHFELAKRTQPGEEGCNQENRH